MLEELLKVDESAELQSSLSHVIVPVFLSELLARAWFTAGKPNGARARNEVKYATHELRPSPHPLTFRRVSRSCASGSRDPISFDLGACRFHFPLHPPRSPHTLYALALVLSNEVLEREKPSHV